MFNRKSMLSAAALLALAVASTNSAQARPAWFGPGSGPVSPYKQYKGFAQVPRQPGGPGFLGGRGPYTASPSGPYRCVPNVALVGANGVCPD
jgi:hypothetical protein